jgi:hypothetical protein
MRRTVQIGNVEITTQELGQPMDGAFNRLYTAFFGEKGFQSVDDEFRTTAFQYFDSYITSVDSPAAHDHYFMSFSPLWDGLFSSGRLDLAEKVWEMALDPVQRWEQARPDELIDKGYLYYLWGATALLGGNLDRGYLLMHQSFEEDRRTSPPGPPPRTPSHALVTLDYEKQDQAFRFWVVEQSRFLETFVVDYAATHRRSLTMDDVKKRFLEKPPNYDSIFLLTFTVARLRGISGLHDQAKRNTFAGQIELNLLFDLLLVIEVAIRHKNPTKIKTGKNGKPSELMFYDQVLFLLKSARHPHEEYFADAHRQFQNNFEAAIQGALDGNLTSTAGKLQLIQCDVHLAYELRNRSAHQVETVPIIWKEFDRVQRSILRVWCATVDYLY